MKSWPTGNTSKMKESFKKLERKKVGDEIFLKYSAWFWNGERQRYEEYIAEGSLKQLKSNCAPSVSFYSELK